VNPIQPKKMVWSEIGPPQQMESIAIMLMPFSGLHWHWQDFYFGSSMGS
jgi:hypothetical protein